MALIICAGDQTFTATAVLELVQRLYPLAHWEPVGGLLETARAALAGHEGLSAKEVARMRLWAARWEWLHHKLRAFYLEHVMDYGDAHFALLAILHGGNPVEGARYGRLKELWLSWDCAECPFDLVPVERR